MASHVQQLLFTLYAPYIIGGKLILAIYYKLHP